MKTITIEELEQLTPGSVTIVDVRPADTYQRGTFEGAINVPMKEFVDRYEEIPKDKPVWVLCHTGERSLDYVELLCSHGYDAGNITGGYRAYLRLQLERRFSGRNSEHDPLRIDLRGEQAGPQIVYGKRQGDRAKPDQKIPEIHLEKFYTCDPEI